MSISRIFQAVPLAVNQSITLTEAASHHLARVLRAKVKDEMTLFNGEGGEYQAIITEINKKNIQVDIKKFIAREAESTLNLCLAQSISRGEKMDYTIQKAVELGVKKIIPLFTERCSVILDKERQEKRLQHWRSIVISACEQSGRNFIPEVLPPHPFSTWLPTVQSAWRFVLSPHVTGPLSRYTVPADAEVILLIGPEGGLSDSEVKMAEQHHFHPLNLGPRVLRTETAAVAALTALQCSFGDMK